MIFTQKHANGVMKIVKYALAQTKMNACCVRRISYELAHYVYVGIAVKDITLIRRRTNARNAMSNADLVRAHQITNVWNVVVTMS